MKTIIFTPSLFLISALVFCPVPSHPQAAGDPGTAAVKRDFSSVYSANSADADIVKVLNKGELVRIRMSLIGSEGTWCLISEEGKKESLGYVSCEDLEYLHDDSKKSHLPAGGPDRPAPSMGTAGTAPPDPSGRGPVSQTGLGTLLQAVWKEDVSAVKELLERGINPNAGTKSGAIPLHVAAKKDKAEMTRTLIAGGADVNARDGNGLTPLMAAASAGKVQNIDVLLAAGADINAKDEQRFTALMWAVVQGSPQGVEALLENNAEINARTKEGRTALWYSKQLAANARKSLAGAFRKNDENLVKELRTKLANHEEIFQILQGSGGKE